MNSYNTNIFPPLSIKVISICTSNTRKTFVLRDGHLLHMVKLVGAVRNYNDKMKNIPGGTN
jgi:hypothetical protein